MLPFAGSIPHFQCSKLSTTICRALGAQYIMRRPVLQQLRIESTGCTIGIIPVSMSSVTTEAIVAV